MMMLATRALQGNAVRVASGIKNCSCVYAAVNKVALIIASQLLIGAADGARHCAVAHLNKNSDRRRF